MARQRYLVLLGAVIVQLLLGTIYGYSIFWQPLQAEVFPAVVIEGTAAHAEAVAADATVVVAADQAEFARLQAQRRGYLTYAFSIALLSFAGVMVLAGRVQDIKGPRFTAIIGGVLMAGGFAVAGLMNHTLTFYLAHAAFTGVVTMVALMFFHALTRHGDSEANPLLKHAPLAIVAACVTAGVVLGTQYLGRLGPFDELFLLWGTIGFLAGAGVGFAYVCPIAALVKWFPNQKGLVAGVAVAGFGFGAYVFSHPTLPFSAATFLENHGVVALFLAHGGVLLVGVVGGAMLLSNPPAAATGATPAGGDSAWQDTLRRPAFWTLWIMFFSGSVAGLMVIGILAPFAGEQLVAAAQAARELDGDEIARLLARGAAAVGWLAIFNAVGRIFWGLVSDRIGRTPSFVVLFLLQAVTMVSLGLMQTELTLGVAAALVGFNYGGLFPLFPAATADLFGSRNMGANYGWLFTSYGIAGVVGTALGHVAHVHTGSYMPAFVVAASLCVIAAALAVALHVNRR